MTDKMAGEDTPQETPRNPNLKPPWKPGQSGNPAGRPKGARSKLSEDFCQALLDDFKDNGAAAIVSMRTERPNEYAKMIAGILTQDVDVNLNVFAGLDVAIKR
ncbi:DUF5681 domain-containing protein [Croceicoccus sp. Ery15]|uniref:DUF5681 domain-containing protein n=1 Tax=Croceicoccus sp. Ery15 TaxID=1703338 RepID=UPI001E2A14A3|nr:DUF5681 domain-containing protein [Croceicoccus sp. Ery15]